MLINRKPNIIGMDKYRKYALTLPLIYKNNQWYLLLEVRAAGLRRQPGEICFPGGRIELGESPESAATRETMEELLVSESDVCMIEPLDVFVSPFDLIIYPYLAELKNYQGTFSRTEVDEVFEVPVAWFRDNPPKTYKNTVITQPPEDFPYDQVPGGRRYPWHHGSYEVVFFQWQTYTIWGLTAAILKGSMPLILEYLDHLDHEEINVN